MENLSRMFQKQKRKKQMKRWSFITQLTIELYYCLPVVEKCLEKCPSWYDER